MFQRIINFGICLIVFSLPLYLVRFRIYWVPVTLLELMIYGLFILWLVRSITVRPFEVAETAPWSSIKLLRRRLALTGNGILSRFQIPIFLIFFGVTIATLFSIDIRISAGIWKGWFLAPLLFFIVVAANLKTKKQIKNVLTALILSGTGVALVAFGYWFKDQLTYDGRLAAFYLSPNYLAMYLSPILILSLYLYFCFKKKLFKISLFIAHCLLFIVIYLTFSCGAWLGLAAAFIFLLISFWLMPKNLPSRFLIYIKRSKLIFYLIGFIVLLIAFSFLWQISSQKFQDFSDSPRSSPSAFFEQKSGAWQSRLIIWQSALEIIKATPHNFLWGVGPGMFQQYYLDYQSESKPYLDWAVPQPHNLFLSFWLQTGLIGLLGFIWLLVIFFRIGLKKFFGSLTPKKGNSVLFYSFLMAAMLYILVHGLVDATYWKNDLSIIFWLIIALNRKAGYPDY